ncbi:MAG: protein kinase [Planctomycetes bacterium]|nr:protein kinase [Planctomycetota bacterium]
MNEKKVWQPGEILADRYIIDHCVRQSATACLYAAEDVNRGAPQLILGAGPSVLADPRSLEWFGQYCKQALAAPGHVNVLSARIADHHRGVPFLVMQYATGRFWDTAIEEGRLKSLPAMLDVALQVARGVKWLHTYNQTHYNLKPANVLIADPRLPKVWKYGQADAKSRIYASPEQLDGSEPITPATDIWSWGLSVLHMFVGRLAWHSGRKAPTVLKRYILHGPAEEGLPAMPGELVELLRECFQTDPKERPGDMGRIVEAMEALLKQAPLGEEKDAESPSAAPEPSEDDKADSPDDWLAFDSTE